MRRLSFLLVSSLLAFSTEAHGTPARPVHGRTASVAPPDHGGTSVGSPTDGRLVGGVRLEEGPAIRFAPGYSKEVRYGLGSLVSMLQRSAREVRRQFPDAVLTMGHLSRSGGGDVDRHVSHESGRDADVGFYVKTITGRPVVADHFVPFRGDGSAPTWPGAYFDDARNWFLVSQLLSDPHAKITHIFVAAPLRARLLAYAAKINAPHSLRVLASMTMAQPRGSLPHDDHFHVRIACPTAMSACIEVPTRRELVARRRGVPNSRATALSGGPLRRDHAKLTTPAPAPAISSSEAPPPPRPATLAPTSAPKEDTAPAFVPPPAVLSEPIDDVDGLEWGPDDPPVSSP